jgi:HAD superfamily hydrolase (TIGR01450 family)
MVQSRAPLQVGIRCARIANVKPEPLSQVRTVLCDLDGVIWLSHQPIPGSVEAIGALQSAGFEVLFVTNNSTNPPAAVEEILGSIGIVAEGAVIGSAQAAASLVATGERVLVCGERGIHEAMERAGAEWLDAHAPDDRYHSFIRDCDTVVVGLDRKFTYQTLDRVSARIRGGARFIATNDDPTYPTPHGVTPGAGSLLAAVIAASGVRPVLAGKPHQPMADLVLNRTASLPEHILMVGDRVSTDGLFARTLRCGFAWVRSGVPGDVDDMTDVPITVHARDLSEVASALLG